MNTLGQQHCAPYAGEGALAGKELVELHRWAPEWHVMTCEGTCTLERDFPFPNFAEALTFTDGVGTLAKQEAHFPEILTEWGRVHVRWWTPTLKGLHRNDFIMAAQTDALYEEIAHQMAAPVSPMATGETRGETAPHA